MSILLGLLVSLFISGGRTTLPATLPGLPIQEQCLVQTKRGVVTAKLDQPAPQEAESLDVSASSAFFNGTDANETAAKKTYIAENSSWFSLSTSLWAQFAFKLCVYWRSIVLLFIVGFVISFPFMHWTLEQRDVERDMFNSAGSDALDTFGEVHEGSATATPREMHKDVTDMLKHICINQSGGLEKVKTLIDVDRPKPRRTLKVISHLFALTFNVFMLVQQDITLLKGAESYYKGDQHSNLPESLESYLEFTGNVSLISVRHAACVALAELIGLAAMVIWILYRLCVFRLNKKSASAKFDAFIALHEVFHGLCLLGGFSALRVLSVVHPALVVRQFQWSMARPFLGRTGRSSYSMQVVYFGVTRIFALFLGVMAFGVKLAFTSVQIHMPLAEENWWMTFAWRWCVVIMLLEQTLGAIAVEHVMWWRVILVIVEGGDRKSSLDKIQIMYVYLSRIMQQIYEDYWEKCQYYRFFVLMLTFDHVDLQHLLIDERPVSSTGLIPGSPHTPAAGGMQRSLVVQEAGDLDPTGSCRFM